MTRKFRLPPASHARSLCAACALLVPAIASRADSVSWNVDIDGNWSNPANWSTNSLPGPSSDVIINRPTASPTVTLDSGTQVIHSLSIFDPFIMNAPATLDLSGGNFFISNPFTFNGGTIKNGSMGEGLGGLINISGGTLDNVTVNSDLTLSNATLNILTALPLGGATINLDNEGINSSLNFTGNVRIFAVGNILFGGFGTTSLTGSGSITLDPNMTVRTSTGNGLISTASCINQGSLFADFDLSITISSPSFSSSGTITGPGNYIFSGASATISNIYNVSGITTLTSGNLLFQTPAGSAAAITGNGNLTIDALSALTSDSLLANSLTVNGVHIIRAGVIPTSASKINALSIAHLGPVYTGKLDLTNNKLILQSTSAADKSAKLPDLVAALIGGANLGTWTGNGLTSGTAAADPAHYALGLFDNALLSLPSFGGQPVNANSLLITIAHLGDANNNGFVDIQDQSLITNNWQKPAATWSAGDLNLNGFVDIQDLTIFTNNWQQQSTFSLTPNPSPLTPSSVPEPLSVSLLLTGSLALLLRRRPRNPAVMAQSPS